MNNTTFQFEIPKHPQPTHFSNTLCNTNDRLANGLESGIGRGARIYNPSPRVKFLCNPLLSFKEQMNSALKPTWPAA